MVLNNNKQNKKASGFTIVELLIVIVVIGILAAITIVAYSGITARAWTTKAQTNAVNVQKVAETYNADAGYYPPNLAAFTTGFTGGGATPSSKLPSSIVMMGGQTGTGVPTTGEPTTSANGQTNVTWACFITCSSPTGGRITYFDFTTGARAATIIYVGAATAAGSYVAAS